MGFLVSIQAARAVVLRVAMGEGGLQSLLEVPSADSPHRDLADLQPLGNRFIAPPRSPWATVRLEKNPRVRQLERWRLSPGNEPGQFGSLVLGQ